MSELLKFRKTKDKYFAEDPQSPLTVEQKRNFKGLSYFPEDARLRVEVSVDQIDDAAEVHIPTSTGGNQIYQHYGRFYFNVEGQEAELTIFVSANGYFLPFVDSLAGKETYPAGRYLEPEPLGDGRFMIDFNLAYNPYCAYNDLWSCPLTPRGNRLSIPIRAGEMIFRTH